MAWRPCPYVEWCLCPRVTWCLCPRVAWDLGVGLSGQGPTCNAVGAAGDEGPIPGLGGEDPLQGEMATPSSILAWETPWTEEPGGLQSMGSQRVGYN